MSFLVDPPILFADGEAYARLMPESAQGGAAKATGAATVAAFVAYGAGAYLNQPWTKPLWEPLGAKSGRDLMLGWPLSHGSRRRKRTSRTDAVAARCSRPTRCGGGSAGITAAARARAAPA